MFFKPQGDIRKMKEEDESELLAPPRKAWGNIPFQPRILPLEVTASAMEGGLPVPWPVSLIWVTCAWVHLAGTRASNLFIERFHLRQQRAILDY